jgi:Ca-activated chloride channel family protein
MVSIASRIRTSLAIGVALGTIIAALAMSPRGRPLVGPTDRTDSFADGILLQAKLTSRRILPQAQDQDLAVTIAVPSSPTEMTRGRPPLSLAIVIDRSGSMRGAPIENARAAALAMLRQLDDRDAFAVVAYSNRAQSVLAMQRATTANTAAARAAIETIDAEGGTCISCGLEAGAAALASTPIRDGLRRVLVISDGQANAGVFQPDALAQLAAAEANAGISISTLGVGLAYDERMMRRLAEVGRGNYYFAKDAVALSQMFVHELGTLSQTVASGVRLIATPGPGVRIEEAYGYPMTRSGDRVIVPIADLGAGETRKVVFRTTLAAATATTGTRAIAQIDVAWHAVSDASERGAHAAADAELTTDPAAVAASVDPLVVQAVERALSARALDQASVAYEVHGLAAAQQVLEQRAQAVHLNKYLTPTAAQALDAVSSETLEGFAKAPAKAQKAASVKAYDLAR